MGIRTTLRHHRHRRSLLSHAFEPPDKEPAWEAPTNLQTAHRMLPRLDQKRHPNLPAPTGIPIVKLGTSASGISESAAATREESMPPESSNPTGTSLTRRR